MCFRKNPLFTSYFVNPFALSYFFLAQHFMPQKTTPSSSLIVHLKPVLLFIPFQSLIPPFLKFPSLFHKDSIPLPSLILLHFHNSIYSSHPFSFLHSFFLRHAHLSFTKISSLSPSLPSSSYVSNTCFSFFPPPSFVLHHIRTLNL